MLIKGLLWFDKLVFKASKTSSTAELHLAVKLSNPMFKLIKGENKKKVRKPSTTAITALCNVDGRRLC